MGVGGGGYNIPRTDISRKGGVGGYITRTDISRKGGGVHNSIILTDQLESRGGRKV